MIHSSSVTWPLKVLCVKSRHAWWHANVSELGLREAHKNLVFGPVITLIVFILGAAQQLACSLQI